MMAHLGRHLEPTCRRACRYVYDMQGADGGWAAYPGGPADLSISVKAYFALKLVGTPIDDPAMIRAREAILGAGGAQECNSFTRFYLALLGQILQRLPHRPPARPAPDRFPISLSNMSAWTRRSWSPCRSSRR
ncbi:MAG: prenyltransferase/squalene oxidase repeat-containing protein [Isosphaeraceae bacterium]